MKRTSFFLLLFLALAPHGAGRGIASGSTPGQKGEVLKARLLQRKGEAVPEDLFLSATDLQEKGKAGGGKLVLVDVRSPRDYAALHLPGALNLPLSAIGTKSFLKGKAVVLMNAGHGLRRLVTTCRRLRSRAGLDVKILIGGVAAWASIGGALVGTARAKFDLRRLSPGDYQVDKSFRDVVVIHLGKKDRELFPEAMGFPSSTRFDRLCKAVRMVLQPMAGRRILYGVLVADDPRLGDRVMRELARTGDIPLFLLQGGAKGYESYLRRQVAAWTRSPTRKSQRGYLCPSCR